jgi:phosphatidylinositol-3-phosphatase
MRKHHWQRVLALFIVFGVGLGVAAISGRGSAASCRGHHRCPTTSTTTTRSTSTTTTTTTTSTSTTTTSAGYSHVVWVVMENHSYSQVIGSTSAPYINKLAQTYGNATNMHAETHPSLPNYVAMTSGGTQGVNNDNAPSSWPLTANSIFQQLGSNWRSSEESMPSNCDLSSSGTYAVKHNPAAYFTNARTACQTHDVPLGSTPVTSAAFTFVTPNLCNDMHDCSVSTGDTWLSTFVPKLLATPEYKAGTEVIFITWDEDNSCSGCTNHVPTIVISPTTNGISSGTTFTHYSMLRATEEILHLPLLGGAASAASMRSAFGL